MKRLCCVLAFGVALAGCARSPERSQNLDAPPSGAEDRVRETIQGAEKGPTPWSPAVTIPLYPVLLVADTTIKFGRATVALVRAIFGASDDDAEVPERVERQAERLRRK